MPFFYTTYNKTILFIYIPKTGGTGSENFFRRNCEFSFLHVSTPSCFKTTPQHMQLNDLKLLLDGIKWDYTFIVVRNPYERIKSEYLYTTQHIKNRFGERPNFSQWVINNINQTKKNFFHLDNHLRLQYHFVEENMNIFKFEIGIGNIIKQIISKIELNFEQSTILKNNVREKDHITISLEALEMIDDFYKKDFDIFGYNLIQKIYPNN